MWKICFGICLSNTKVCFLYVFIEDWRQTWAGGEKNSVRWRALLIFSSLYFEYILILFMLTTQGSCKLKTIFRFYFSRSFDRTSWLLFSIRLFFALFFCLIVHFGKIRSNPLERWYECWYVNNINNRWKCGDLMMDWAEVRFSFCFSRETRCDGKNIQFSYIFASILMLTALQCNYPKKIRKITGALPR